MTKNCFKTAIAIFLVSLSSKAETWKSPKAPEVVLQIAATALIWIDVAQTLQFTARGQAEWNPILGLHPSPARVVLLGGVLPTLATTAIWYALPSGWRCLPSAIVIGVEVDAVLHNAGVSGSIRF